MMTMHLHPLPVPPWSMPAFEPGNWAMLVMNGPLLAAGFLWAVYHAVRNRNAVPLALLLGGMICSLHEPLIDVIAHCFVPYSDKWSAFSLYGRPVTWWHPLSYGLFYGLMPAILLQRMKDGLSAPGIWLTIVVVVLFDLVMEGVMVRLGTWRFYGNQPLMLAGMPIWWGAMNCIGVLTTATIVFCIEPYLRGARALILVVWLPFQHAADIAIVGWPSWVVINSEVSPLARQIGGIASYGAFVVLCAICVTAIEMNRNGTRLSTMLPEA